MKRKIQFTYVDEIVTEEAHTYVFITPDYAVGGIWERIREFDNEQKRWDITLPLTQSESAMIMINKDGAIWRSFH